MKRILTLLAAIVCLCSCGKQENSHWLYEAWGGEYDIIMINNDTGEEEPHVGTISLMFSEDRTKCTVYRGVKGLYAMTMKTYHADLYDDTECFALRENPADSKVVYVSDVESGKRMLKWYSGDKQMSITIESMKLK